MPAPSAHTPTLSATTHGSAVSEKDATVAARANGTARPVRPGVRRGSTCAKSAAVSSRKQLVLSSFMPPVSA